MSFEFWFCNLPKIKRGTLLKGVISTLSNLAETLHSSAKLINKHERLLDCSYYFEREKRVFCFQITTFKIKLSRKNRCLTWKNRPDATLYFLNIEYQGGDWLGDKQFVRQSLHVFCCFLFWWVKRKKMLKMISFFFQLYSMIGVLRLLLAQDKLPKPFDKNWIAHMMDHRSGLYVSYFLSILSDVLSREKLTR